MRWGHYCVGFNLASCEGLRIIEIARPEKAGALTRRDLDELTKIMLDYDKSQEITAVVITGSGANFCSGAEMADARMDATGSAQLLCAALSAIAGFSKPLITAVAGAAAGAGWMIAALGDERIATADAKFSLPEVKLGLSSLLGYRVLANRAPGLPPDPVVLGGATLSAAEALRYGAITGLVEDAARLASEALARATALAQMPAETFGTLKQGMRFDLLEQIARESANVSS